MTSTNPHSTVQIAGHPIHPMLIPFPVAFLVATFRLRPDLLENGKLGLEHSIAVSAWRCPYHGGARRPCWADGFSERQPDT
jgi:hypothetical protein